MNQEARFIYTEIPGYGDGWQLDDTPPTVVTDPDQLRRLLRDPAPKSLVISDEKWGAAPQHAILCAEIPAHEIAVKRLALYVLHVSRPMTQAIGCLGRLPVEYLAIDAYPSSESGPLDLASSLRTLHLRGLVLRGYAIGNPTPLSAQELEELHLFSLGLVDQMGGEANLTSFFDALAALPRLHALTIQSGISSWTLDKLQPIARLTQLSYLNLGIEAPADAITFLISSLPSLELVNLPYNADDTVAAALVDLQQLKTLRFARTRMTDAGFASIARIRSLEELNIVGATFTDDALAALGGLINLKRLGLSRLEHVTMKNSLQALSRLTRLEMLDLHATPVDPRSVSYLASLRSLRMLRIGDETTPIACNSIGAIGTLTRLEELRVTTAPACLEQLRNLSSLKTLIVDGADNPLHPSPQPIATGDQLVDIARLPITQLRLGSIDDTAAAALTRSSTLRTLDVDSYSLSTNGIRRLMASRSLRQLGLGGGADDHHSWEIWKTVVKARCGNRDLEVRYCPAPFRSMPCGTKSGGGRTCSK